MRFAFSAALATVLAIAGPPVAGAQSVPNLSGTWSLQVDKSDFGTVGGPKSRTDVIVHQEPKFSLKRVVVTTAGQENTTELVCAVDGTPYKNSSGQTVLTSVLRWDGQTLVMVTTTMMPEGEVTITDRFALSADGQTLTQARTLALGAAQTSLTMVLAKQP